MLLAELGAEATDVDVDRAGAAVVLVAPDPAEQRLAGEDLARVLRQELEQLVLHVREVERLTVDDGLVGLEVEHEVAVLDELGCGAEAGAPEQVAEPGLELAGVERIEAEVVVELVAQVELVEAVAADQQEQRLDGQVALADGPAQGPGRIALLVDDDDGAAPAVVGRLADGDALVGHGLPGVAAQVEQAGQLRRRRIGVDEQRFHGQQSPGGQVPGELERGDLGLVVGPLGSLVAQEPLEDVVAERFADQLRAFHGVERFGQRLGQVPHAGCGPLLGGELQERGGFVGERVALVDALEAGGEQHRVGEVRVAGRVGRAVLDAHRRFLARLVHRHPHQRGPVVAAPR